MSSKDVTDALDEIDITVEEAEVIEVTEEDIVPLFAGQAASNDAPAQSAMGSISDLRAGDRRRGPRAFSGFRALFSQGDETHRGTCVDISTSGAGLFSVFNPEEGSVVDVLLSLPSRHLVAARATVVRVRENEPVSMGLRFSSLAAMDRSRIEAYVSQFHGPLSGQA